MWWSWNSSGPLKLILACYLLIDFPAVLVLLSQPSCSDFTVEKEGIVLYSSLFQCIIWVKSVETSGRHFCFFTTISLSHTWTGQFSLLLTNLSQGKAYNVLPGLRQRQDLCFHRNLVLEHLNAFLHAHNEWPEPQYIWNPWGSNAIGLVNPHQGYIQTSEAQSSKA